MLDAVALDQAYRESVTEGFDARGALAPEAPWVDISGVGH